MRRYLGGLLIWERWGLGMECRGEENLGSAAGAAGLGQAVQWAQSPEPAGMGCVTRYPPAEPAALMEQSPAPGCWS